MGEDARKIDWKSTAKTGQAHVKLFYEEREVHVALCLLMSGSLLFEHKKQTLLKISALLGYQALKNNATLTPIMISQKEKLFLPSSKKQQAVEHFIKRCDATTLKNSSLPYADITPQINRHLRKKSFLLIVGDFLGDFDFTLLASRHELYIIMIRDSFEENPTPLGEERFLDPESGEDASFYFGKKACEAYKKRFADNDAKLIKHLRGLGIAYEKIIECSD